MEFKNILIKIDDGVAILTINRPSALNALNAEVFSELDHFFSEFGHSIENLKGVVITGSGEKAFIAGADITEFIGMNAEQGSAKSRIGMEILFKIENYNKPVIAAINGFSLGGGNELAMACHMIIATEKSKFGQPEMNLGLITGYGGTQRLTRNIGKAKAMELLLTGDVISAQEALNIGLINHIAENAVEKACEIINKIGSKSPFATEKMIGAVNAYFDKNVNGYELEIDYFGQTIGSHDGQEGSKAFTEKRKPDFKGF
ncbi:MAG: enoyl-CoA hydratase/isomerase family protein [Deltaproteobacteria bacterium]